MKNTKAFSFATCLAFAGGLFLSLPTVEAAAPKCQGSTGGGNRWTCTDDYKAAEKPKAKRFVAGRNRLKVKQIPCYQSDVPGCRE